MAVERSIFTFHPMPQKQSWLFSLLREALRSFNRFLIFLISASVSHRSATALNMQFKDNSEKTAYCANGTGVISLLTRECRSSQVAPPGSHRPEVHKYKCMYALASPQARFRIPYRCQCVWPRHVCNNNSSPRACDY